MDIAPRKRNYRVLFWTLALVGLTLDLASKYVIFSWLYEGPRSTRSYPLVPGYFSLRADYTGDAVDPAHPIASLQSISAPHLPHVNRGALFGIGHGRNLIFALVSVAAAVGILVWSWLPSSGSQRLLSLALGLILAGTLGNLYDRVVFEGVRDFLHFYIVGTDGGLVFDWPVFNVADCFLVAGAGFLLLDGFVAKSESKTPAEPVGAAV